MNITIRVKVKNKKKETQKNTVKYYDFEFLNYRGEKLLYCCVAPNIEKAYDNFCKYTEFAPVTLLGVTCDEKEYVLQ